MKRNLERLVKQGYETRMNHLSGAEAKELVELIHSKGEFDAIAEAYFVGVALGYNQAKKDFAQ